MLVNPVKANMEKNLYKMKPHYNQHILPVP